MPFPQASSTAVLKNPETVGLKGRLYRGQWQATSDQPDLRAPRDAYQAALEHSPDSYYMGGNVGELSLALSEKAAAEAAYKKAVAAIRRSGQRSF